MRQAFSMTLLTVAAALVLAAAGLAITAGEARATTSGITVAEVGCPVDAGPDTVRCWFSAVNAQGHALGHAQVSGFGMPNTEASFLWTSAAGMEMLPPHLDGVGINDLDWIVAHERNTSRAAIWDGGVVTYLTAFGDSSMPLGINNQNQVLGSFPTGYAIWDAGSFTSVEGPEAYLFEPRALNDNGQVAGRILISLGGAVDAFLWETGATTSLGVLDDAGPVGTLADVNNAGQVVGSLTGEHAFMWSGGVTTVLPSPASRALAINDKGEVVGRADGNCFYWSPVDGYTQLPVPGNTSGCVAHDINDAGLIVGEGFFQTPVDGHTSRPLLWTVPPPIVIIDGCNTGVTNQTLSGGGSFSSVIQACAATATNHGQFVSCVTAAANGWKAAGHISGKERSSIVHCAAHANLP